MRIAFISDIHGNLTALQAVLADIQERSIDQIVCLGDTITMGPQPAEVLKLLRELKCVCVKGNHEAATLDPEHSAQYEVASHLIPDLNWCRSHLSPDDLQFINSFEPMHSINLSRDNHILAFHGSPLSSTDIIQATTPDELLDVYFEGQNANIFIGGHSHVQMVRRYNNKLVLNSGSIGNAFKYPYSPGRPVHLLPWAEYMIIEQGKNSLGVDARRVNFDINELLKKVKENQQPSIAWWLNQYP